VVGTAVVGPTVIGMTTATRIVGTDRVGPSCTTPPGGILAQCPRRTWPRALDLRGVGTAHADSRTTLTTRPLLTATSMRPGTSSAVSA